MIAMLAEEEVPWDDVEVFQTDERIAPHDDPGRNLTLLEQMLPSAHIHAMPVEEEDVVAAAREYAAELPERLDLVHLGLGTDGHTASLVPGCAALDIRDRDVAISIEYHGRRRMTLTYPAIDRARQVVWLVVGEDKREALRQLLNGDPTIPASHVESPSADGVHGPGRDLKWARCSPASCSSSARSSSRGGTASLFYARLRRNVTRLLRDLGPLELRQRGGALAVLSPAPADELARARLATCSASASSIRRVVVEKTPRGGVRGRRRPAREAAGRRRSRSARAAATRASSSTRASWRRSSAGASRTSSGSAST